MRLFHQDKAVKLSPNAEADLERRLAESPLNLTPDEANEIGLRVAREAEERSRPAWTKQMRDAGEPTADEAADLDRALAELADKHEVVVLARIRAEAAAQAVEDLGRSGYELETERDRGPHSMRLARARDEAKSLETLYDRALEDERYSDKAVMLARGNINRNGARRQARFVGAM